MTETDGKKKIIVVSFLAMLIGSIMLIITLFVPFASATDDQGVFRKVRKYGEY